MSQFRDTRLVNVKANSKVNLLNDDTYRWDCETVIITSSSGQIEQGAH